MITRKIYDDYDDFKKELREFIPHEIFYNYTPQLAKNGMTFYLVSLSAITHRTDTNVTIIHAYEAMAHKKLETPEEAEAQANFVKTKIEKELLPDLQDVNIKTFLKKGTLQIEG